MITIIGGIALFLLGMTMLTNGLKEIAGETLKKWLNSFTRGTFTSIFTGALMTILVQSSTPIILLTIGFVSAGLLSFIQSIGIIIGANIGNVSTSWIISLVGFKINLQAMSLPIIAFGVFIQLITPNEIKKYGGVFTGFGLIFLGINFLQQGMGMVQDFISFESINTNSVLSILLLIAIGIVMKIVMQASSATVAATLTALYAGAINFEQAAFLVIGQHIGTTATTLVATIGASVGAKRTAMSHVLFNVVTGVIVTIFSKYILKFTEIMTTFIFGEFKETLGIPMFLTIFSLIGTIIFVPFISPISKILIKLIPEKENALTRNLDYGLVMVPSAALEVAFNTLLQMMNVLTNALITLISAKKVTIHYEKKLSEVEEAVEILGKFLDSVQSDSTKNRNKQISIIHALDHLIRLIKILRENEKVEAMYLHEKIMNNWLETLIKIEDSISNKDKLLEVVGILEQKAQKMAEERKNKRDEYFELSVIHKTQLEEAASKVDALLWIDRLVYHYWRATARLADFLVGKNKEY